MKSIQICAELEDEDAFAYSNKVDEEKHFDFRMHPNEIRLSEQGQQACVHLINLVGYQTDCDDMA